MRKKVGWKEKVNAFKDGFNYRNVEIIYLF